MKVFDSGLLLRRVNRRVNYVDSLGKNRSMLVDTVEVVVKNSRGKECVLISECHDTFFNHWHNCIVITPFYDGIKL